MIVDRVDVLTKEDFDKAIKEIEKGSKFLTEVQANEKYALKGDIPNVSNFVSDTQLSDYALKTEIPSSETIVNKAVEKVEKKGYLTEHQSLNGYVTETQLTEKGYLTKHQDISNLATKKSVEAVENKVTQLENRPVTSSYDDSEIKRKLKELEDRPTTTNIDTSNFVTTTQLEDKHYLTEHQPLTDYVTKNELRNKNYLTEHQDISKLATKEQLDELRNSQPTVNTSDLVTKEQLRKAFLDDEEHEKYAKKSELPQPYNDADIKSRLTTLENRPAGSGGNVDASDFVTKQEFEDFQQNSSLIFNEPVYDFFQKDEFKKDPEKDGYIGKLFKDNSPVIFKGERDESLEYVEFQQLMRALIDVLPDEYVHYGDQKITFLTDKNFKEMVATPEFKAVVKESLRDIVKEIISENN